MARITGSMRVVANGVELATLKGATVNLGNAHWKHVQGDHRVLGKVKQPQQASLIKAPVSDRDDLDVDAVAKWEDVEVQVEADNGKTYIFKEACVANSLELSVDGDSGGKWDLELSAPSYQIAGQ